jgi:hypothetical protein
MFIDMHVHPDFYEPISREPESVALRRTSLHILKSAVKPLRQIFLQMESAGLNRYCLLARDYSSSDGRPAVSNSEVHSLCQMHPDKFIAFASVNPDDPKALENLEYAFGELKLSGLKLHPGRQHFYPSEARMNPIYEMCLRYDKPILFHSGMSFEPDCLVRYSHPLNFEEAAARYPKLRIGLAHFGWPWIRETAMLMLKYPNVYADTALLYFDNAKEFYETSFTKDIAFTWIDRSLRHQVMFGSNYPRFEQVRMAKAIACLGFRDSTVDLIKGQNAVDFIGGLPG